ncbi:A/G-specific adenine glycosylase [Hydrogenophaga sp. A37]|uniref:A/G-specific adenine glycosylase n=1 Tax=Hydrogenophaga sp. A37 TaxID=1945864 RepID=UPI00098568C2|nr:A/G-specific adenine glycosylase [Hydrogenophaga sp. A37]OOG81877.1 A/G-specific adenine glycosylase [Hydrogenophaga sp. A37]
MTLAAEGAAGFAPALIGWQRHSGRHDLPWQGTRDPYRVWLSEIMLQQTQVSTVLGYYERFLQRFPDVHSLADAPTDDVMTLWSGLGYYSRARNLHRCAQTVVLEHGGAFPANAQTLETLPGIGASTAAAIAAFCHGERISIVDGNVRRVLSRLLAFDGDLSQAAPQRALWSRAQDLLPADPTPTDMVAYTQGLMDLGASICSRTRPGCERCPVRSMCLAHLAGTVERYPVKTRKLLRRHESWWLQIWRNVSPEGQKVWLERRPARGIWAGLYCAPVFESEALAVESPQLAGLNVHDLPPIMHSLTHRELRLHPLLVDVPSDRAMVTHTEGQWVLLDRLDQVGLPTPLRTLLQQLPD